MLSRGACLVSTSISVSKCTHGVVLKRPFSVPTVKVVAEDVPMVMKRAAEKAVKEAVEHEKEKVSKSSFSQRISPFLWGFLLTSVVGIYYLNKDLTESNRHLQDAIVSIQNDKRNEVLQLEKRIEQLENKM